MVKHRDYHWDSQPAPEQVWSAGLHLVSSAHSRLSGVAEKKQVHLLTRHDGWVVRRQALISVELDWGFSSESGVVAMHHGDGRESA